jgi:hypothetical protein
MMITCPKCGFVQPQDRYCAKCGVDMENFKPSVPPLLSRILSSPIFHILLAFVLVFIVIIFVRKHSQEEFISRVEFLKGGPTVMTRQTVTHGNPAAPALPPTAPPPPPPPPPLATEKIAEVAHEEDSKKSADTIHVRVLFAEVDHQTMEGLRRYSRETGQFTEFGDFRAGALPAAHKANSERGVRILERKEEKLDRDHMSANATVGVPTSPTAPEDSELGLTYSVNLTHIEPNLIRGEIEVMHLFHETTDLNDAPVRRTYPSTTFELSPGMSWMVTLNLPLVPQVPPEDGEPSNADGIMRIFQSPQYKSRQTEFTLFFEFDRQFDKPAGTQNAGKNAHAD